MNSAVSNTISGGQTVISFTDKSSKYMIDFEEILSLASQENSSLKDNYGKWFYHDEQLLYSIVYDQKTPIMISTLCHRDFYAFNVARALNRTWKRPDYRNLNSSLYFSERLHFMLKHQCAFAKDHFGKQGFLFISHQKHHPRLMRYWEKNANLSTGEIWRAEKIKHRMLHDLSIPGAEQWICYTSFSQPPLPITILKGIETQ